MSSDDNSSTPAAIEALRKRLLFTGFTPLPAAGKAVHLSNWTKTPVDSIAIETWQSRWATYHNTSLRTTTEPAIDIDVYDTKVADEIDIAAWECLGGENGKLLRRTGLAPKRAFLCRTDMPFRKKVTPVFVSPDGTTHKVEILGDGQQIVAFGIHPDTHKPYTWDGGEPGEVVRDELPLLTEAMADEIIRLSTEILRAQPGWIEKRSSNGDSHKAQDTWIPHDDDGVSKSRCKYAEKVMRDECDRLRRMAPDSGRNDALNKSAFLLGKFAPDGYLTHGTASRELYDACEANGLTRDDGGIHGVTRTITSGWSSGQKHPWVWNDYRSNYQQAAEFDGRDIPRGEEQPRQFVPLGEWDAGLDHTVPPPREWLLGNIFCREFASSIFADGAVGKTSVRYAQFLSMAVQRPLTGDHVFQRCRILIVSLEDGAKELRRRILAAILHHGVDRQELAGWLYLAAPGLEDGERLLEIDQRGRLVVGGLAERLEEVIVRLKIDIISLDPLVKLHSVGENDNTAMDKVASILTRLAIKHNIAVDVPHHNAKGPPAPGDAKKGRGAGATKDAFRLVYTLTPMSLDEGKEFGLSDGERRFLIRMDSGKVNIAPPSEDAIWFKLVGVNIGNATDQYPNGDNVQTVERWKPPPLFADVSVRQVNDILNDIDKGLPDGNRYTDFPAAKTRAAWRVIRKHVLDKTEEAAKKMIASWRASGLLFEKDYANPTNRNMAKGLWVDDSKRP